MLTLRDCAGETHFSTKSLMGLAARGARFGGNRQLHGASSMLAMDRRLKILGRIPTSDSFKVWPGSQDRIIQCEG
jgi:hypothetical protein